MNNNDTLPPTVLLVVLGRFNLTHWRERGSMNREVARYVIHPDYTHYLSGDSDLAILILKKPVVYNPFIRPVCLWFGPSDLQNVVRKMGYVVGWGQDEYGNSYTKEPRMTKIPIVSQVRTSKRVSLLLSVNFVI